MLSSCCSDERKVLIFACSGGSNVGQIVNEAAKKLTEEGLGRFFCLAGIGGDISGIIETTKGADEIMVLDGCSVACAKAMLDKLGAPIACYVDATDLGISKEPHFNITEEEIEKVCEAARSAVSA